MADRALRSRTRSSNNNNINVTYNQPSSDLNNTSQNSEDMNNINVNNNNLQGNFDTQQIPNNFINNNLTNNNSNSFELRLKQVEQRLNNQDSKLANLDNKLNGINNNLSNLTNLISNFVNNTTSSLSPSVNQNHQGVLSPPPSFIASNQIQQHQQHQQQQGDSNNQHVVSNIVATPTAQNSLTQPQQIFLNQANSTPILTNQNQFFPAHATPIVIATQPNFMSKYDGSRDIVDFLNDYEATATSNNWFDAQKINNLTMYLDDNIRASVCVLDSKIKNDHNALKSLLLKEYGKDQDRYMKDFDNIKPEINEKTRHFVNRIKLLLRKAMPNIDQDGRERLLRNKLFKYLPQHIQTQINTQLTYSKLDFETIVKTVEKSMENFGDIETIMLIPSEYMKNNKVSLQNDKFCNHCNMTNHNYERS
jgi:hypothetical protein